MNVPRLIAISADGAMRPVEWELWCSALAAAGVPALQVRNRGLDDRERFALAKSARAAFPVPRLLSINGRFDVALAAGADGVHLPARGLPVAVVRRVARRPLLVGRSTHSLAEIERARDEGADYVFYGPIFETPSKVGRIPARGISSLADASRFGLPVIALGGLDRPELALRALAAGAHGVAGIRAYADPRSAAEMVRALIEEFPAS